MAHKPTAKSRKAVAHWAANNIAQKVMASRLRINTRALRRHYREELKVGLDLTAAHVQSKLMEKIDQGNLAAIMFWLRTRSGWSDKTRVEFEDKTPGAGWGNHLIESMTPEQRKEFRPLLQAAITKAKEEENAES